MIFDLLLIFLMILCNALFNIAEVAIIASRRSSLEKESKKNNKSAKIALYLADTPSIFLSTVQIGITIFTLLSGVFGEKSIAEVLTTYFKTFSFLGHYAETISTIIVLFLISYFTIIIGEIVPKRIAYSNPEYYAYLIAKPINWSIFILKPFIFLTEKSSDLFLFLMRINEDSKTKVTEDEIKALVKEGKEDGEVQQIEHDIVERVFHLGDRKVGSLMTHRTDILWININDSFNDIIDFIKNNDHSLYPICDEDLDKILGLIYVKDIIKITSKENINKIIKNTRYFHENTKVYKVLEKFKEDKIHMSIVVDEYGSTQGIITLNDILEEIVGDFNDDSIDEPQILKRKDGTWLIDAQFPIDEFINNFEIDPIKLKNKEFHTIGGFVLDILEEIPKTGDIFEWDKYEFEVIDMDKNRIDKILIKKIIE